MPGYFYPLPPANIGGRQPYAPRLGQVQSGPAPSTPPPVNRASFGIIEARHREDPWTVIYVCRIAPLLSAPVEPDAPPVRTHVTQRIIAQQWQYEFRPLPTTVKVGAFAPAPTASDNPPQRSYVTLNLIARQWMPPFVNPKPRSALSVNIIPPGEPNLGTSTRRRIDFGFGLGV